MKHVFVRLTSQLQSKGVWHEVLHHTPVYTSEQASQVRQVPLKTGVKAMVLKSPKGYLLVLVRADKRVDLKLVKELEKSKVRLATPSEVLQATGCEIGSVPPFGFKAPLKTYLDRALLEEEKVTFNAGLHTVSVVMKGPDLPKAVDAILF